MVTTYQKFKGYAFTKLNSSAGDHRTWFSREDWEAVPPQVPLQKAEGPVSRVYFHYRTGTRPCYSTLECFDTIQKIQENHIRRRMGDIAFK